MYGLKAVPFKQSEFFRSLFSPLPDNDQSGFGVLRENSLRPHKTLTPGRVPHVRPSVHGLNTMGRSPFQRSHYRSHRDRLSKSIRKMSYPAHVRWGEGHPSRG